MEFNDIVDDVIQLIISFLNPWESIGISRVSKRHRDNYNKALKFYFNLTQKELIDFTNKSQMKFNFTFSKFNRLLMDSVENNYLNLVKLSIKNGADVHLCEGILMLCVSQGGHLELLKYLFSIGANIHADDDDALRWASRCGQLEIVKFLISKNAKDAHGYALRVASGKGHIEVVKFLVSVSAYRFQEIYDALGKAYSKKHEKVVEFLEKTLGWNF